MSSEESVSSDFKSLNLAPWLIEQCAAMGITKPTPVQLHCIPKVVNGENCVGISKTGTGKTLAFALPILQLLAEDPYGIFALILTPTRELAIQIAEQFSVIGKPIHLEVSVIIGGMNMVKQGKEISDKPHIIVATPGRLADHLESCNEVSKCFSRTKILVLDEADRLLEGPFNEQLLAIFDSLPSKRQTLLFSATMSDALNDINKMHEVEPFIWKCESEVSTVEKLDQRYILVGHMMLKNASLVEVVNSFDGSMIIFTKNCNWCQIVSLALKNLGFQNVALNSHLRQWERIASLSKFKSNRVKILVATDVASRGLDIPIVDLVINYHLPLLPTNYIHRVGRTARAGKGGLAISILTPGDLVTLLKIEKEINTKLTKHKISEKEVNNILLQVEVTWREARISLENTEVDQRKKIYKMKEKNLQNSDEESAGLSQKKRKKKQKHKKSMLNETHGENKRIENNEISTHPHDKMVHENDEKHPQNSNEESSNLNQKKMGKDQGPKRKKLNELLDDTAAVQKEEIDKMTEKYLQNSDEDHSNFNLSKIDDDKIK